MSQDTAPSVLSHDQLRPILERIHATLAEHRAEIDELNVFPVPDGDTGTNMTATARAALEALSDLETDADREERSRAIARAALRGARGNSGVILSQVLRALIGALTDGGELDVEGLAAMFEEARELAYEAVADPVEGTILTTITRAAISARNCAKDGVELGPCLERLLAEVESTTEDTLQMLQANRDAGVVDAGARGFALVVKALCDHVTGKEATPASIGDRRIERSQPVVAQRESGSLKYRFEVQYLLEADAEVVDPLRSTLRRLGDSVTVVNTEGLVSVHVHTNDVGAAIEAGLEHGRPSDISVVYFADQMAERQETDRAALGCVVVLPAGRLHELAAEHGATPVPGASGELPSVDELVRGIREAHARHILLLPGHRNVVPTARQARDVASEEGLGEVRIVSAATSVPAVVAALAVFDPAASPEVAAEDMDEAVTAVRTGEVVSAVRDADTPIGRVREGQHLTIVEDDVVAASDDPIEALETLTDHYADEPRELVTLIIGGEVDENERERAVAVVRDRLSGSDVEVVVGEQRPARYLLGVE